MRLLIARRSPHAARGQRGMTLIELIVALTIASLLVAMGTPFFGDYIANARLREGGTTLLAETLFAQSEAIKRNGIVRVVINGSVVNIVDRTEGANTQLRTRDLPDGVRADAATQIDFGGEGRPAPFPSTATVDLSKSGVTCSAEYRCPSLRVEAGGGIRLCGNKSICD